MTIMMKGCGQMESRNRVSPGTAPRIALGISGAVLILCITLFLPACKSFLFQKMNRGFMEQVDRYALSANIKIVGLKYSDEESGISVAVSAGASGVVFHSEGGRYFALTARHVIADTDGINKIQFVAMRYDDLDYADALEESKEYRGIADYYQQFPEADVEYSDVRSDLAVISFSSDETLAILPVSDEMPGYRDIVAAMGNPHGKRNIIAVGRICSRKPVPFGDEAGKEQHAVIRHTCVLSEGSSGSALLNENLEIVGINLGGGGNLFRRHLYGMAMPSDRILDFLKRWKQTAGPVSE